MPEELATADAQLSAESQPGGEERPAEEMAGEQAPRREGAEAENETPAGGLPPSPPASTARGDEDGDEGKPKPSAGSSNKRWYVVKVQSGREESIKEAIERRVKIEGLEEFFGQIIIPVERVTEMRNGKRVVRERKLYPGYLMVEVEYNDRILYLFRETSGVGDFVGGSMQHAPPPMSEREVERMLGRQGEHVPGIAHPKPKFDRGDRVKVKDGTFAGMEGEVKDLLEAKGLVRVELTIFGRPVPVELEYWQVEPVS
jgi:transcription termination/antitermination protein NusG